MKRDQETEGNSYIARSRQLLCLLIVVFSSIVWGEDEKQTSNKDIKRAQDPFEFSPALDYRQISFYEFDDADLEGIANYRVRYTHPVEASDKLPEQLIRITTNVNTVATRFRVNNDAELSNHGNTTGVGDTNIFDSFTLGKSEKGKWGIGPSITIPTNSDDKFGNDNWRGGLTALGKYHFTSRLQFVGLINWQKDFGGSDPDVNLLFVQPSVIYHLFKGWTFINSAIWSFDLEHDTYYIPVALGFGKVFRSGNKLFNAFIEPTWTIAQDNRGKEGELIPQPKFLVRIGVSIIFAGE